MKGNSQKISTYFKMESKLLLMITLTGILYNVGMIAGPYFEGRLVQCLYDCIALQKTTKDMIGLVLCYLLVILFVQVMRCIKRFGTRRFANDTSRNMRRVIYHNLIHMDKAELEKDGVGTLMTKAISDVDACAEGMRKFTTEIFDTGVVLAAYVVMLLFYDWKLTLLACLFVPLAYVIADQCKVWVVRFQEAYKKNAGKLNQMTYDRVENAITYRVFGREQNRDAAYEEMLYTYEKSAVFANFLEGAMQPIYHVISMGGVIFIIYFGSKNVLGNGWTVWDLGTFTTFMSCFVKLALKSSKAAKLFNAVQKASVSWERIKPFMKDVQQEKPVQKKEVSTLSFQEVSVGYQEDTTVLEQITMSCKKGEIIGITGAVASGKSSFGKVLIGEVAYQGSILLDGQEFKTISQEERRQCLSYMGHEAELFSQSIQENILLGKEEDVWRYLTMVSMKEEVEQMPQKEFTYVGNGGIQLSGGQQARLALARTLCHSQDILILDDPFSAVDKKTEQEIFDRLRLFAKDKIVLLISHRLHVFPQMNRILWIQDKRVIQATHEELMTQEPAYAQLYRLQEGGDACEESGFAHHSTDDMA